MKSNKILRESCRINKFGCKKNKKRIEMIKLNKKQKKNNEFFMFYIKKNIIINNDFFIK